MIEHIKKYKLNYISIIIIIITSFSLLYYFFDLSKMDINVPLFYNGGDSANGLYNIKLLKDGNNIIATDKIGAPFGTNSSDYMSNFMDNFDNLISKILIIITGNIGLTYNIQYLFLFPIIGIISFFVLRNIKIRHSIAILGSLTFSFLPYIFIRNQTHIVLSEYQFIPLSILLCIWIYNDDDIFNKLNKKNLLCILFLVLIANNGIAYYPFFTCYLLLITGISKCIKQSKLLGLKQSFGMIGIIFVCVVLNLIPYVCYILKNGANPLVANRSKIEAEIYGLKITQFFIPNNSLHIPILNKLITYYGTNAPLPNEGTEHLGVVGCIGIVILFLALFIKKNIDNKSIKNIEVLSELNIFAILLGTIGGFGSIFSLVISSSIRGYNRISIYIAFIGIMSFCIVINEISKISFKKYIFYPIILIIFIFSIFEQYPNVKPDYNNTKLTFYSDKKFVDNIEKSLAKGSMIYQLPYHQYPETGPVNAMHDYDLFTGYFHSNDLKWSYGGMKGRRSDIWNQKVASLDTEDMVKTISIAGFNGIYIDKRAYTDANYNNLEMELTNILKTKPVYSDNKLLVFFNMNKFNKRYKSLYNKTDLHRLKDKILNMNIIQLGAGFSSIEGKTPDQWIWLSNKAQLIIYNYTNNEKTYKMNFNICTAYQEKSNINIYVNDKLYKYTSNSDGTAIHITSILKKGKNIIKFGTNAKRVEAPQDSRQLYLRITDFDFFKSNCVLK